jgi:hypothetical protein
LRSRAMEIAVTPPGPTRCGSVPEITIVVAISAI